MKTSSSVLVSGLGLIVAMTLHAAAPVERTISATELRDKLNGFWIGQLAGNYVGFPFENLYVDEPLPVLVDRFYDFHDAEKLGLRMNLDDRRGYVPILADALGGAWSDDDTDIEFVTLHAVEQYGLDLTYPEITEMWKQHINRFIWSASRRARDLMDEGVLPPATGSRADNEYWYRITSQLMNEIWGAFYPGMTVRAAERSDWGARIMTDDWAVHPDIAYGVMFSAAFFEDDPHKLVELAIARLPADSPFARGMRDVLRWHDEHPDWRDTRRLLHENYEESIDGFAIPYRSGGSIINGLCAIMALVYGDGDFTRTVGIATSAGYDCDNQAATCGGLIGVMHGAGAIPAKFTLELPSRGKWKEPFNDTYINYSRDGLPAFNRISDIVDRIMAITERAIVAEGGARRETPEGVVYVVRSDLSRSGNIAVVEPVASPAPEVATAVETVPATDAIPARPNRERRRDPSNWVWVYNPKPVPFNRHEVLFSAAMQREVGYNIYLPTEYDAHPERRYSVVYFLHGSGGNEESGAYMASMSEKEIAAGRAGPVVWVYVNGGQGSGFRDWPDDNVKTETMIMQELIPYIESHYRVRTDRAGRGVCGYSMGGNGAARYAAKYPDRFCAVATIAGAFGLDRSGAGEDTVFHWTRQNVEQIRDMPRDFFVGALDRFKADQTRYFAVLDELNLGYQYTVLPNRGHQIGEMWNEVVPPFVRFMANACARPLEGTAVETDSGADL